MAIIVKTQDPNGLVEKIRRAIDRKHIDTWSYDDDGDFTHDVDQWRYRAWIHANIEVERVVFSTICRINANMTIDEYAIYHGRFVEMLLAHFDSDCSGIEVSPLAMSDYDMVNSIQNK